MKTTSKKTEIIGRFLEYCEPSRKLLLDFVEVDEDVFECETDPAEIVNLLTGEFAIADLMESGIVVARDEGVFSLSPALTEGCFVVMRDAVTHEPYDLLTVIGCLSATALPVFEIMRDGHTQQLIEQGNGDLVVAFDLKQVIMLRACGIPATLGVGLDNLPLEQVNEFSDLFCQASFPSGGKTPSEIGEGRGHQAECNVDDPIRSMMRKMHNDNPASMEQAASPADSSTETLSAEPFRAQLAFLGWNPAELSNVVPPQLKAVVDYFQQLHRFMNVDLYDMGLWEVTEETIAKLEFIAARKSAAIFKRALLETAENINADVMFFGKEKPATLARPNDYPAAVNRLSEISSSEEGSRLPGPNQKNEAWRDVQRLLSQQVVGPVRELALATSNPVERNLLTGFAELSNVFHMQSLVMSEQFNRRVTDRGVTNGGQLPEDQFKNLIAMADRLIGIAKATEKCSQPRTKNSESWTIDSPSIPRLPHSG